MKTFCQSMDELISSSVKRTSMVVKQSIKMYGGCILGITQHTSQSLLVKITQDKFIDFTKVHLIVISQTMDQTIIEEMLSNTAQINFASTIYPILDCEKQNQAVQLACYARKITTLLTYNLPLITFTSVDFGSFFGFIESASAFQIRGNKFYANRNLINTSNELVAVFGNANQYEHWIKQNHITAESIENIYIFIGIE